MKAEGVGYTFAGGAQPFLTEVALSVAPGEVVLVTGPTGSGKSTLLRLLAGILGRQGGGSVAGTVTLDGRDISSLDPSERVEALGFVGQEPQDQLLAASIGDEVAFALESSTRSLADADEKVAALLAAVGLSYELDRSTAHLSGGEIQRLEVAAALSADAQTLLLDEPLAQVDPSGAGALLQVLKDLALRGRRVVLAEHRLEAALPIATRLVVLAGGRVRLDVPASSVVAGSDAVRVLRELGLQVPGPIELLDPPAIVPPSIAPTPIGEIALRASGLEARRGAFVLGPLDLEVRKGERVAVVGANGAGKSTLLEVLAGWVPHAGIERTGRIVLVPQDPDLALVAPTVAAEIALAPSELGLDADTHAIADALDLVSFLDAPPQALSRGQRQRVAVAAALAAKPAVLVLDEPTTGQDRAQVERLLARLPSLLDGALLFATHDLDLAARLATRIVVLVDGKKALDATPQEAVTWLAAQGTPLPAVLAECVARGLEPMSAAALARVISP